MKYLFLDFCESPVDFLFPSISLWILSSDKQEDIDNCCNILRSEIRLLFELEGMWQIFNFQDF